MQNCNDISKPVPVNVRKLCKKRAECLKNSFESFNKINIFTVVRCQIGIVDKPNESGYKIRQTFASRANVDILLGRWWC